MPRKVKIAVSVAQETLELVDRHADGRSRSACIEQELLRALRAREWERFSAQMTPDDVAESLDWASQSFADVDLELERQERAPAPTRKARTVTKRALHR